MVGIIAVTRGEVQAGFGRLDSDAGALKHSKNWALKTASRLPPKKQKSRWAGTNARRSISTRLTLHLGGYPIHEISGVKSPPQMQDDHPHTTELSNFRR